MYTSCITGNIQKSIQNQCNRLYIQYIQYIQNVLSNIVHTDIFSVSYCLNLTNAANVCLFFCRPSSFPPSYEESQGSQPPDTPPDFVVMVDCVDVMMTPAPPLYSQDSSGAPDCTLSWEQPPRYSQVERIQRGRVDAD